MKNPLTQNNKYKAIYTFLEFPDEWNFDLLFFAFVVRGTDKSKGSTARGYEQSKEGGSSCIPHPNSQTMKNI